MNKTWGENFYPYTHLEAASKIVCFGIGRFFDFYLQILRDMNISQKICALIDNSIEKQGLKKRVNDRDLVIYSIDYLVDMVRKDRNFIILVTAVYYEDILRQLKLLHISEEIRVFIARELQDIRVRRRTAVYSNLFQNMNMGISERGENMTISVLAHNRAELTVRLVDSVCEKLPGFMGKLLIGDNGSEPEELDRVKSHMGKCPFSWEILEFDRHYPIPVGKNMINREVKTDWILQLDNDIYFIDDPLEKIGRDIDELGCFVWGLPYQDTKYNKIVNYGSNLDFLYEKDTSVIRCCVDRPFCQTEKYWPPMLCTYAAGGASLFRKELIENMGGYDENLYMFEDVEFMYRVNQMGYKIGNIGMLSLVHDHKSIDGRLGRNYDKIRFDAERINRSSAYLMKRYGFEMSD